MYRSWMDQIKCIISSPFQYWVHNNLVPFKESYVVHDLVECLVTCGVEAPWYSSKRNVCALGLLDVNGAETHKTLPVIYKNRYLLYLCCLIVQSKPGLIVALPQMCAVTWWTVLIYFMYVTTDIYVFFLYYPVIIVTQMKWQNWTMWCSWCT